MLESVRVEPVGSLLRPPALQEATANWWAATQGDPGFSAEANHELKQAQDAAVREAVRLQENAGLDVVTDGEMRRSIFAEPLFAVNGISPIPGPPITFTHVTTGETETLIPPLSVTEPISRKWMQTPEEFVSARSHTTLPVKVTLSSPLTANFLWNPECSPAAYADPFDFFTDVADLIRAEILELARLGCTYIQIDAPEIIQLVADEGQRQRWRDLGIDPTRALNEGIDLVNAVAQPVPGVTFALHNCRANSASMYVAQGGYDGFTQELLKRVPNYARILLEHDDDRSGTLEHLEHLPADQVAVLGLVSTKRGEVESLDTVERRAREAIAILGDRDRIALSTQCGFASSSQGNDLNHDQQFQKLALLTELAAKIWE